MTVLEEQHVEASHLGAGKRARAVLIADLYRTVEPAVVESAAQERDEGVVPVLGDAKTGGQVMTIEVLTNRNKDLGRHTKEWTLSR